MARTIGELNSSWAALFKFFLVAFPVLATCQVAFGAWVVGEVMDLRERMIAIETVIAVIP